MSYLLLVLGFLALVKGASMLVAGASSVARRFNISDFAIGMTVSLAQALALVAAGIARMQ